MPIGPARDLWGALALGIPPAKEDVFSVFAESGTIHTLVVSGLQVTLVMVALEALWRRLLGRGSGLASCAAGFLYCGVVGFSAPVWRGPAHGSGLGFRPGAGLEAAPCPDPCMGRSCSGSCFIQLQGARLGSYWPGGRCSD